MTTKPDTKNDDSATTSNELHKQAAPVGVVLNARGWPARPASDSTEHGPICAARRMNDA